MKSCLSAAGSSTNCVTHWKHCGISLSKTLYPQISDL